MDLLLGGLNEDIGGPDFVLGDFAVPGTEGEVSVPLPFLGDERHEEARPRLTLLLDERDRSSTFAECRHERTLVSECIQRITLLARTHIGRPKMSETEYESKKCLCVLYRHAHTISCGRRKRIVIVVTGTQICFR